MDFVRNVGRSILYETDKQRSGQYENILELYLHHPGKGERVILRPSSNLLKESGFEASQSRLGIPRLVENGCRLDIDAGTQFDRRERHSVLTF